jgi:hypothetical protein
MMAQRRYWADGLLWCLGLVLLGTAPLPAVQGTHPTFAGTWILDAEKSAAANGRAAGAGAPLVTLAITEDGPTMTIQRKTGTRSSSVTYRLDGKDVTNENPMLRLKNTFRSHWEGSVLVTEIWAGTPTGPAVAIERRSLVQPGEMFLETKREESPGEVTTTKMFFKKQGSSPPPKEAS